MPLINKFKEGFWEHIGSTCATALMVLFAWIFYQIAPALLPAIEATISLRVVLAILLLSVLLNIVLVVVIWHLWRSSSLKLKFGILWDREKNPYCPSCKNGGVVYGKYTLGAGYLCKTCNKVFDLVDARGKNITPDDALPLI